MKRAVEIALVEGDGIGPETAAVCCPIIKTAAETYDDTNIIWRPAPMGWNAWDTYGDTYPKESREIAIACGIVYFFAVGDKEIDKTLGKQHPEMMPETRCLLGLRADLGLSVNIRPVIQDDLKQYWMRYLLEDGYFGTRDLLPEILTISVPGVADTTSAAVARAIVERLGIKLKHDVKAEDVRVTELAYFTRARIVSFTRYVCTFARKVGLPVINLHKANILARSKYWEQVTHHVRDEEFPDVEMRDIFIDAAMALLHQPTELNGVVMAGNEHGDIGTDGAAGVVSLGIMSSSAVNPETKAAMFESGAGTACDIAGKGIANPIGRILTGALMLRHIGATRGAEAVERAVRETLQQGLRTRDLVRGDDEDIKIVGTDEMGNTVLQHLI